MRSIDQKATRIVSRIQLALRGNYLGWASDIAAIIEEEKPDAVALAGVITRLHVGSKESHGSIWTAREMIVPYLQAQIGLDQIAAARRFGRAATWLGWAAVIFSAIQVAFAALVYYR